MTASNTIMMDKNISQNNKSSLGKRKLNGSCTMKTKRTRKSNTSLLTDGSVVDYFVKTCKEKSIFANVNIKRV